MVAAWSVDRLGRSLTGLLELLTELHAKKVDLYLHQQGLDTSTPSGRAMFQMMGVFAEFERAMIQERVRAGLRRAKSEGKQLGRPPIAPELVTRIREARAAGLSVRKAAARFGVAPGTVQNLRPFRRGRRKRGPSPEAEAARQGLRRTGASFAYKASVATMCGLRRRYGHCGPLQRASRSAAFPRLGAASGLRSR
jgi:DNA invertase Pin-like site-specific DNA recombinase